MCDICDIAHQSSTTNVQQSTTHMSNTMMMMNEDTHGTEWEGYENGCDSPIPQYRYWHDILNMTRRGVPPCHICYIPRHLPTSSLSFWHNEGNIPSHPIKSFSLWCGNILLVSNPCLCPPPPHPTLPQNGRQRGCLFSTTPPTPHSFEMWDGGGHVIEIQDGGRVFLTVLNLPIPLCKGSYPLLREP